jgi:hypothetical protein
MNKMIIIIFFIHKRAFFGTIYITKCEKSILNQEFASFRIRTMSFLKDEEHNWVVKVEGRKLHLTSADRTLENNNCDRSFRQNR